ncbi:hypothetical protein WMY93_008801 [Mugilogobius chulae]|uniref:Uncharacterized protein n=1 Tax=Mugilogobius chulae TaxID=88201 RepID=A0AAW0PN96_9GOBI
MAIAPKKPRSDVALDWRQLSVSMTAKLNDGSSNVIGSETGGGTETHSTSSRAVWDFAGLPWSAPQTRRRRAVARKNQPRDAVEATAVVVRPAVSSASSTPGPEEQKVTRGSETRRSLTRSSPGLEVRPCSPASTPRRQEEDQAVVEVRSLSPQRPSYADVVKGLSPVPPHLGWQ